MFDSNLREVPTSLAELAAATGLFQSIGDDLLGYAHWYRSQQQQAEFDHSIAC